MAIHETTFFLLKFQSLGGRLAAFVFSKAGRIGSRRLPAEEPKA